ncbi:minor capsid protein [Acinetobacter sp. HY1485]|uniref:minor capsid protein n=1 Tax=Acinetobacter sp. HY1485 TaxID=2970918 RepID=UPI0022B96229|nr:minor capsid protein [Acinetobacter sp. HY1485]
MDINALIQHQAYLYRLSSSEVSDLIKQFDDLSSVMLLQLLDILSELSSAERTALMAGQYTTVQLKEVRTLIQTWQQSVNTVLIEGFQVSATALAVYEAQYIARQIGKKIKPNGDKLMLKAKETPLSGGALLDSLFSKLSADTKAQVENVLRDGLSLGQTNEQIVRRIKGTKKLGYADGLLNQTRSSIDGIVRTARSHVANVTYSEIYKALGTEYLKFVSVLDSRTSKMCGSLDGTVWEINSPNIRRPPLHRRCRSILVGVDKTGETLGQRPSNNGKDIKTVDSNTSFKDWFADQDEKFQKNWLGAARFKMYQDGKYSFDKFFDPLSGQIFTLKELNLFDKGI